MDDFLQGRLDDLNLLPLIRKVESIEALEEPVPLRPTKPPSGTPKPEFEKIDTGSISISSADDLHKNLGPLFMKLKQAAKILGDEKPDHPQPYRWLRFSIWDPLKSPPLSKDRVTRIPPPAPQLLAHLESLYRDGDWRNLLQASESALHSSKNLFFIDLNRYSHAALSKLGDNYQNACDAVLWETNQFTARLSGLTELFFEDRTPFADEETKQWLTGGLRRNRNPEALQADTFKCRQETEAFIASLGENTKIRDIVPLIQRKIHEIGSGEQAMVLRLDLIRRLAASNHEKLASSQIEHVLRSIDAHSLDTWNPDMAFSAYATILSILNKYKSINCSLKPEDIYVRLGKIDVLKTMDL
jgi:type VI secretion system protein VasJ